MLSHGHCNFSSASLLYACIVFSILLLHINIFFCDFALQSVWHKMHYWPACSSRLTKRHGTQRKPRWFYWLAYISGLYFSNIGCYRFLGKKVWTAIKQKAINVKLSNIIYFNQSFCVCIHYLPTSTVYGPWSLSGLWLVCCWCFRYADHPAFLGIELLNEPSAAAVPLDTLVSYYKQGYEIVRKYSTTAYVIVCQRIGNADPLELYQANIGLHNIVVDLHFYNLFDPFFANMSSMDNIQFIYKSRESQLQALNSANGPLIFIGKSGPIPLYIFCQK